MYILNTTIYAQLTGLFILMDSAMYTPLSSTFIYEEKKSTTGRRRRIFNRSLAKFMLNSYTANKYLLVHFLGSPVVYGHPGVLLWSPAVFRHTGAMAIPFTCFAAPTFDRNVGMPSRSHFRPLYPSVGPTIYTTERNQTSANEWCWLTPWWCYLLLS